MHLSKILAPAAILAITSVRALTLHRRHEQTVSPNARCGKMGSEEYTCLGSNWGDACSVNGWCGPRLDDEYSGDGCQEKFGRCGNPTPFHGHPACAASKCGHATQTYCFGSDYGYSCSQYGYCGDGQGYSTEGCQPTWGLCGEKAEKALKAPEVSRVQTCAHAEPTARLVAP